MRLEIGKFMILKKITQLRIHEIKKSSDLDQNSQSNQSLKLGENLYREIDLKQKLKQN